jgi:hypothetical protein
MIGKKEEHFSGKSTDLSGLQAHIEEYLKSDGFTVQSSPSSGHGTVIQAKKAGFLRAAIDADHALTITISGSPDDFTVTIGFGKWLENIAVAAAETLILSELFLVVDVAENLWTVEIEDKLGRKIKSFVG